MRSESYFRLVDTVFRHFQLILDAVIQFNQENCRYPGTCQTDDVDKSAVFEILLKDSSLPRSTNYYDGFVQVREVFTTDFQFSKGNHALWKYGIAQCCQLLGRDWCPRSNKADDKAIRPD